jgi:hypothetical protein
MCDINFDPFCPIIFSTLLIAHFSVLYFSFFGKNVYFLLRYINQVSTEKYRLISILNKRLPVWGKSYEHRVECLPNRWQETAVNSPVNCMLMEQVQQYRHVDIL